MGKAVTTKTTPTTTLVSPPSLKTRVGGVFPPFRPALVPTTHGDEKNRHRLQVLITRERIMVTMKDGRPLFWLRYVFFLFQHVYLF